MKIILPCTLFFIGVFGANAQAPIQSFYVPQDRASYTLVESAVPLSQETSGANINWNFSQLIEVGTSEVRTVPPTSEELAAYQNTTAVTVTTATVGSGTTTNKIFSRTSGSTVSITGFNTTQIELIYDMDNATLGSFPMQYGFTNSDGISGSYNAEGGYSGSFNGNSTTSVDAYGTLTLNIGLTPVSTNVTRLKTTQNIILDYLFLTNVGTVTQTVYSYYRNDSSSSIPVFRSTRTNINVPMLSVDYTTESLETFETFLQTRDFGKSALEILPNPVEDVLNIHSSNNEIIREIHIFDLNGRSILKSNAVEKSLDVSQLHEGIYLAEIKTDFGTSTKKITKK